MKYFFEHPDGVIRREELLDYLWDCDSFADDNTLSVNISRVRQKLTEIGIENLIETKRGLGYALGAEIET